MDMLNALIKAEINLMNICDIVHVEQPAGEQFYTVQCPALPSIAKKTLQQYAHDTMKISQESRGSSRNKSFSCGEPHPWSKMVNGKYVVVFPNAIKPGVHKKAKLNISKYQACQKKNAQNNKKRRNLNTVN